MTNFPSKWYDFINHKELKRLRKDLNDTLSLRIEIAVSIILMIISCFLESQIDSLSLCAKVILCVIFCTIVAAFFILPIVFRWYSLHHKSNVFINGKEAKSIFDEEIVYDVLVASEYCNIKKQANNPEHGDELKVFYSIEIKYYVNTSVEKLTSFNSNFNSIFGNEKNKIPLERIDNIVKFVSAIIESEKIELDSDLNFDFDLLKKTINENMQND